MASPTLQIYDAQQGWAKTPESAENSVAKWHPQDCRDKCRGWRVKKTEKTNLAAGAATNVVDFMSLLKKSLAAKQSNRAHSSDTGRKRRTTSKRCKAS